MKVPSIVIFFYFTFRPESSIYFDTIPLLFSLTKSESEAEMTEKEEAGENRKEARPRRPTNFLYYFEFPPPSPPIPSPQALANMHKEEKKCKKRGRSAKEACASRNFHFRWKNHADCYLREEHYQEANRSTPFEWYCGQREDRRRRSTGICEQSKVSSCTAVSQCYHCKLTQCISALSPLAA